MRLLRVCSLVLGGTLLASPVAAAPDQTQGIAIMSGAVRSDGTLVNSSGIVSVQKPPQIGEYRVSFIRSITTCTRMVSIGRAVSDNLVAPVALITTGVPVATPHTLRVAIANRLGQSTDSDFHVIVFCAR